MWGHNLKEDVVPPHAVTFQPKTNLDSAKQALKCARSTGPCYRKGFSSKITTGLVFRKDRLESGLDRLTCHTKIYRGFPQSLQTNYRLVATLKIGGDCVFTLPC